MFYIHCGESKTQQKWLLDEKRDGLVDKNRVNNKENKNNRAFFMLYLFAYNINNNEKLRSFQSKENNHKKEVGPYRGFGYFKKPHR